MRDLSNLDGAERSVVVPLMPKAANFQPRYESSRRTFWPATWAVILIFFHSVAAWVLFWGVMFGIMALAGSATSGKDNSSALGWLIGIPLVCGLALVIGLWWLVRSVCKGSAVPVWMAIVVASAVFTDTISFAGFFLGAAPRFGPAMQIGLLPVASFASVAFIIWTAFLPEGFAPRSTLGKRFWIIIAAALVALAVPTIGFWTWTKLAGGFFWIGSIILLAPGLSLYDDQQVQIESTRRNWP